MGGDGEEGRRGSNQTKGKIKWNNEIKLQKIKRLKSIRSNYNKNKREKKNNKNKNHIQFIYNKNNH